MVLPTSADAPITCAHWDQVMDEDGFLALGRNRYHCTYVIYTDGTYYYAENGETGVLDYGGPNNIGVTGTDCRDVFQAVMDNLTSGGLIFVKEGTYLFDNAVTFQDDVTVLGQGTATKLKIDDGVTIATSIFDVGDSINVEIGWFEMDGNKANGAVGKSMETDFRADPGDSFIYFHDLYLHDFDGYSMRLREDAEYAGLKTTIERVSVYDGESYALYANPTVSDLVIDNWKQYDCWATVLNTPIRAMISNSHYEGSSGHGGNGDNGLWLNIAPFNCMVSQCVFASNDLNGLLVSVGNNVLVKQCTSYDNGVTGFICGHASTEIVTFIGCISYGNVECGYSSADDAANIKVIGCKAYLNEYEGIWFPYSNCTAIGNHVWDNGAGLHAGRQNGIGVGIVFGGASTDTIVQGNRCWDSGAATQEYGIRELNVLTDYSLITGNIVRGNTVGGLYIRGPHSKVKDNKTDGTNTIIEGAEIHTREWLVTYGTGGISLDGDVPVAALANGEVAAVGFQAPEELQQLIRAYLKVLPNATQGAANWDLDSDYGGVGEAPNTHSETDAATTYNVTNNEWYDIELVALGFFANLAAADRGGMKLTVSTAGHDASVFSLIFEYV